jgi:predicted membrane protein (TIGR00267 family)
MERIFEYSPQKISDDVHAFNLSAHHPSRANPYPSFKGFLKSIVASNPQEKTMQNNVHPEPHFMASNTVRDVVIGMSDGLTVPFAIAAGMSGASVASHVVIIAGLAEIAAGSISMGLGGFLSGRTDIEHYEIEREREVRETEDVPEKERREVADILANFGVSEEQVPQVVEAISEDRQKWVEFMMRFELGLEKPDPRRALQSALTIGLSYALSGFIPLSPYILIGSVQSALYASTIVTLLALLIFGFIKGKIVGVTPTKSALQTIVVGGLAAAAAFGIARLIS